MLRHFSCGKVCAEEAGWNENESHVAELYIVVSLP